MSMQWYIIHTYSGFEKKVKESLESRVAAFSLQDKIGRVLIPMEDVVEVRGGKKVVSSRTLGVHEKQLVEKGHFARIHRKFMLNLQYLKRIESIGEEHIAHLTTGDKIVVSRRKARTFLHH